MVACLCAIPVIDWQPDTSWHQLALALSFLQPLKISNIDNGLTELWDHVNCLIKSGLLKINKTPRENLDFNFFTFIHF